MSFRIEHDSRIDEISKRLLARRQEISVNIYDALTYLSESWHPHPSWHQHGKLEFALLHHTLYEAQQASVAEDEARVELALRAWEAFPEPPSIVLDMSLGAVLVVDSQNCQSTEDDRFDSTPYTINEPTLQSVSEVPREFVYASIEHVTRSNVASYLEAELGVIVILKKLPVGSVTTGYSLTGFPGTVFTDWTENSVRLGESLLHESTHSWLNECISLFGEDLSTEETWYSPWKKCMRPAFGIIHASLAFSVLVQYFQYVLETEQLSDALRDYCRARFVGESMRLRDAAPVIRESMEYISCQPLRSVIGWELESAVSCVDRIKELF